MEIETNKSRVVWNPGIYSILALLTAMIGYQIHNSFFWAIMDFFFMPFAWIKWLIMHEVNITIIKETFSFFLK
jgi:hypothetical protein